MTIHQALAEATRRLKLADIDSARLDARLLLAHLLEVSTGWLFTHADETLTDTQQIAFAALVAQREARRPVAHIIGSQDFWSLTFRVTDDTLVPRPDTETVVEAVLDHLPDRKVPLRLLDLGTGTGCLLLALLSELPAAWGVGIDRGAAAAKLAQGNARRLGLAERARFLCGDWAAALSGSFHVIVGNPPYIPDDDIAGLQPEVSRFEPWRALAGGKDGLDAYRRLAPEMARLLAPSGCVALEVGQGQADAVAALLAGHGFAKIQYRKDLGGIDRCVIAAK